MKRKPITNLPRFRAGQVRRLAEWLARNTRPSQVMANVASAAFNVEEHGRPVAHVDVPDDSPPIEAGCTARLIAVWRPEPDSNTRRIVDISYRLTTSASAQDFGHAWVMRNWPPEHEGKWVFNRGDLPISQDWWPAEYCHPTLAALLDHLEATFVEGVAANKPT